MHIEDEVKHLHVKFPQQRMTELTNELKRGTKQQKNDISVLKKLRTLRIERQEIIVIKQTYIEVQPTIITT